MDFLRDHRKRKVMMTRDQQGVVLFLGLLLTLIFVLTPRSFSPPSAGPAGDLILPSAGPSSSEEVWVEVDGPVRNRGIYPLEKGKSVREAVEKAGGTSGSFSLSPESGAVKIEKSGLLRVSPEGENKGGATFHPLDPPKMKVLSIPININTAKVEELDILPGVGPKMAQAIIAFREAHGKFSTLEDLQKVKGFGPKKFAAIRPHITLAD
jgi:competence protein ComEA